jgi:hypothetical protein
MEDNNYIVEIIKNSSNLIEKIYGDIAKPGFEKAGSALETVIDLSNTILLPIKLLNETSRLRFNSYMKKFKNKVESIENEKICPIPPEIGIPIIDNLTYTTNEEIADLFLNLLTTASSTETVQNAHPSFVQIIKNLSFDEARIIKYIHAQLLKHIDYLPFITIRATFKDKKGFLDYYKGTTALEDFAKLEYHDNISLYIDNLISLGILKGSNEKTFKMAPTPSYEEIKEIYKEHIRLIEEDKEIIESIEIIKGYYQLTELGKFFIIACSLKAE